MDRLNVLIIEDSALDATLLIRELNLSRYEIYTSVVQTQNEFIEQLSSSEWDCIISDFHLPLFSAVEALKFMKQSGKDIPFIIVSGGVGEDNAVEAMRNGAHDFFLKGRLVRLIPAIEREIAEGLNRKARKVAEESLKSLVLELESEKSLRENFVIGLCHDLRTPLTSSKLALQLHQRNLENDVQKKSSGKISAGLERIERMIQDLLDANSLKSGEPLPIKPEDCFISDIIAKVVKDLILAHGERFVLTSDIVEKGSWDKEVISRMMENLIGNALKYGKADAKIIIGSKLIENNVLITVTNMGNPISTKDQEHLFNNFKRSKSAKEGGHKGWGIGLGLVQGYARAHGGDVDVTSSVEWGTTFSVLLPWVSCKTSVKG